MTDGDYAVRLALLHHIEERVGILCPQGIDHHDVFFGFHAMALACFLHDTSCLVCPRCGA